MIELSGVRISWDILWIKVVFIWLFASARSLALRNSSLEWVSSSFLIFSSLSEVFSFRFRRPSRYKNRKRIPNRIINEIISVVLLLNSFSFAWSINSFFSALSFSTFSRVANSLLASRSLAIFKESSTLMYFCRNLIASSGLPICL